MNRRMLFFVAAAMLCLTAAGKPQSNGQAKSAPAQWPSHPLFAYRGNAAEIPAAFIENLVFLPVTLNESKPSLFALDTSAKMTSVDPERAKETGLVTNQRVALITPGVLFPFDSIPAIARPDLAAEIGRPYEGTIGADFLNSVVVEIDNARQTVRIFDPSIYKYTGRGKTFPLVFEGDMPVIRARFSSPRGKESEADFGISTSVIAGIVFSEPFALAHHLVSSHGKGADGYDPQMTGGEAVSLYRLKNFQIASWSAPDIIAEVSKSKIAGAGNPKLAGVIGAGMLHRYNIVLDYPHKQIILEANNRFKDYDEEDKSGIAVVAKGSNLKTFEVVHVAAGSPAAEGGVKVGDIIAGINDEAAADIRLDAVRDMFRQVGHTYNLTIQRGDQTKQISIQMRRLL
ncbi:MAG TPA: PDZ domain-containing protein [Candidatus Limnocylindrales bacterium]|nr:PDZ domain-containing protein [Candidatus Limnocylindrales bacterium]